MGWVISALISGPIRQPGEPSEDQEQDGHEGKEDHGVSLNHGQTKRKRWLYKSWTPR